MSIDEEKNLKTMFAKNLNHYMAENGKIQADIARYMHISSATASDWCNGNKMPRGDKLQKIANWLGIGLADLMTEHDYNQEEHYYINKDARDLAEFLHSNPDYKVLFDATRNVKPEDIQFVKEMIDRMNHNE